MSDEVRTMMDRLGILADDCAVDGALRARCATEPRNVLEEYGVGLPQDMREELLILRNDADTYHMVMPVDPNTDLSDEVMRGVTGGTTAGTAGTIGSAATASSIPSTVSSASSVGSAGTASSSS